LDLFDKQADNIVGGAKALLRMLERYMVRWGVTRRIVWAWVLTIPGAAMIGAGIYQIALR
jgi:phosphate/sulfate permease